MKKTNVDTFSATGNDNELMDRAGRSLINMLGLKLNHKGRVDLSQEWGDKTPQGLARSVIRILQEAGVSVCA